MQRLVSAICNEMDPPHRYSYDVSGKQQLRAASYKAHCRQCVSDKQLGSYTYICICIYPGIVRMSKVGEGIDKLWGRAAVKSKVKHCPGTVGCGAFIHEKVLYMYSPCPWPSPCGTYSRLFLTQAKGCRPDVEAFERSFPFCSHKLCNAITKSVCQSALFTCIILR